jgi:CNP1-like family protein
VTRIAVALASALLFGCGLYSDRPHVPFLSDEPQGPPPENALNLPSYPQEKDLLEFAAGRAGSHRYFIDKQSLVVGTDGIVRYAVIVRAAGGAVSASYEGIRCNPPQKRLFAVGRGDKWIEAKNAQWTEIRPRVANEYQATLYMDFFCPNRLIVRDRDEALRALLRSGSRDREFVQ